MDFKLAQFSGKAETSPLGSRSLWQSCRRRDCSVLWWVKTILQMNWSNWSTGQLQSRGQNTKPKWLRGRRSERPTVVSLVGQLVKLRLVATEKIDDYFVRSQELMTRLSDAGERVSDTLFNALVINGLPEQYEHFVVQESFQPATTFQELRKGPRNFEDAKRVRQEEQQTGNHVAMHGLRKGNSRNAKKGGAGHKAQTKKGIDHITCYWCKKKGHYQRDCKEPESSSSAKTFSASRSGWKLESSFVVDSGCTDHVVYDRSLFTTFEASNTGEGVVNPNGSLADVKGKCTVEAFITDVNGIERMYKFHDVLFVPSYNVNLMSVSRAEAKGNTFIFKSDQPVIQCGQDEALPMCLQGQLYYLRCRFSGLARAHSAKETRDATLRHRRMGHISFNDVKKVHPDLNRGQSEVCEVCLMSKLHELPVPKQTQTRSKHKGERVFSDIQGPFEVSSLHGARYALTFIDDFSRYAVVNFVVRKSDTLESFKEYVVRYGAPTELRTDNGGEYTSTAFKNYCKSVGIHQELTVPGTPQQNGVAERFNRVSIEMTRCLLLERKLGKQFWVRAMATAVYLRNRCPTSSNDGRLIYEVYFGNKPKLDHVRVFGCLGYVLKRSAERSKLDNKATKAKFIGYDDNSKAYLMMDTVTQKVLKARSVTFDENNIPLLGGGTPNEESEIFISLSFPPRSHEDTVGDNTKESAEAQAAAEVTGDQDEDNGQTVEVQPANTRPRREIGVPTRYGLAYSHAAEAIYPEEPGSYREAMESPEKEKWQLQCKTNWIRSTIIQHGR